MNEPKVTIIILNWNGKEDTMECLDSLKNITYPNYSTIFVDNGSTDGSVEYLKEYVSGIEIIENRENIGFAAGNNVGIRRAVENKTDYVLLLNNDTILDPDFLTILVEVAEKDDRIGVVGPRIYQYDNKEKILLSGAKILFWKGCVPRGLVVDVTTDVDMVSGCCMLVKKATIETIGVLDETYFFGWEDAEYCVKAKESGYKIVYAPAGIIWHKVGGSYGGYYASNPTVLTEGIRNQLIFISRHASFLQKLSSILFIVPRIGFVIFWRSSDINDIKTRVVAVVDGFIKFLYYRKKHYQAVSKLSLILQL